MFEGIIIKAPEGSEPVAIRQGWLMLRFVFRESDKTSEVQDNSTGEPSPIMGREFLVSEVEAFRIMDTQRPGMADYYRDHTIPELQGCNFVFAEDDIHFLPGTHESWG